MMGVSYATFLALYVSNMAFGQNVNEGIPPVANADLNPVISPDPSPPDTPGVVDLVAPQASQLASAPSMNGAIPDRASPQAQYTASTPVKQYKFAYPGSELCPYYKYYDTTDGCPAKYRLNRRGKNCERHVERKPGLECAPGFIKNGNACTSVILAAPYYVCPNGYEEMGKTCRAQLKASPQLSCPNGYAISENGLFCASKVHAIPHKKCPKGSTMDDNECWADQVVSTDAEPCKVGFEMKDGNRCVRVNRQPAEMVCTNPSDNLNGSKCFTRIEEKAIQSCSEKSILNEENGLCVEFYIIEPSSVCNVGTLNENGICEVMFDCEGDDCEYSKGGPTIHTYREPSVTCPPGHELKAGRCIGQQVSPKVLACPGSDWIKKEDSCHKIVENPAMPLCPLEFQFDGTECVQVEVYHSSVNCLGDDIEGNNCSRKERVPMKLACPAGAKLVGSTCEMMKYDAGRIECPLGYLKSINGECIQDVEVIPQPKCSDPSYTLAEGVCKKSIENVPPLKTCLNGYEYDQVQDLCILLAKTDVIKTCPQGTIYDPINDQCYKCFENMDDLEEDETAKLANVVTTTIAPTEQPTTTPAEAVTPVEVTTTPGPQGPQGPQIKVMKPVTKGFTLELNPIIHPVGGKEATPSVPYFNGGMVVNNAIGSTGTQRIASEQAAEQQGMGPVMF